MSDLHQLCAALGNTCADADALIQSLDRLRVRMRTMSAAIARIATAGDGSGAHAARMMQLELAEAMRRCTDAAAGVQQMQRLGRRFIARAVGGSGITQNTRDHVLDGHLTLKMEGGELSGWLSGGHFLGGRFRLDELHVDPASGVTKVGRRDLTLSTEALAELNEILEILIGHGLEHPPSKAAGSTFYPLGWTREACETAFTAAWNDPNGTRTVTDRGGRWSGSAYGLRIDGFFDPDTGECVSAWPVLTR
ncbi:EndoU domain-containing protein [Dactylosporangium sp. AC04546]|uniref:EndoU domain-containing protein n=1 Tax=Dactylosporangium sp. AC04546 TaxID=2862460 RepID=UPI001EE0E062|nr:EndoU domain-containing protein [Dactylosporangium sp. AC04546]WVK84238.1 EndoU domain-containing protein [Dactylosporangium sp. AC04546]